LRVAEPPDSRLVAKRIGGTAGRFYALPRLFEHKAAPRTPLQLVDWPLLVITANTPLVNWTLRRGEQAEAISFRPRLAANDHHVVIEAMHAGLGIAHLPMFVGDALVAAARAVVVLPRWLGREVPLYLIYPSHKSLSPALRQWVDFLSESLAPHFPLRAASRVAPNVSKGG
jgi:DNA-binding transcriptional LysR family regulator